ncbi:MAG: TetR/AcrR family transcriptional regulator [Actinomycetota bacterium]|nr:TetR/AcrR family transcriptional regulator [Actinomycetota bacterium]
MIDAASSESSRARPLAVEARRDMILAVVIPLIIAKGRDVTSREIAEACGIAEGTIFRAFGDKETLLNAAIERYLDPEQLRANLRSISVELPLDVKLRAIFGLLVDRFSGVIHLFSALGRHGPPPRRDDSTEFVRVIDELLAPNRDELRVLPETVAHYARVVAFASSLPVFGDSIPFSADELVELLAHGVAAPAASTTHLPSATHSTSTRIRT